MLKFLAIYVDKNGGPRAAMLTGCEPGDLPFGADEFALGLPDYDGEPVTLIEMPAGDFRPMVVDVESDAEVEMAFVDLADVAVPQDD